MSSAQRSSTLRPAIQETGGCESVQDILNIAATAEAFAATFLGTALDAAATGALTLDPEAVGSLVAARAEEQAHYDYLTANGAVAQTTTFTVPDGDLLTNPVTFYQTVASLEEAFVAAYLTAAQSFAAQGQPALCQVALQIGAVEAEHRVGVRFFGITAGAIDDAVPNDVAFEKALFGRVSEAADLLAQLGFIGGTGTAVEFPGPGAIDTTGIRNLVPPTPAS